MGEVWCIVFPGERLLEGKRYHYRVVSQQQRGGTMGIHIRKDSQNKQNKAYRAYTWIIELLFMPMSDIQAGIRALYPNMESSLFEIISTRNVPG